jgi:ClpP class serine protease
MGVYSEYLGQQLSFDQLSSERKKQLERISHLRSRGIIVYASDISGKNNSPDSIDHSDILPFSDQLSVLTGNEADILIQTPGGLAEVVEDLVNLVRSRFERVGVIVPGAAYSAGTIFTIAADEILMCLTSSLDPIDAQIMSNGKRFSADAFLEGIKKIKDEVVSTEKLNIAYVPILQSISP